MDPCMTCTDATRAFYVRYELCPETCQRMRRIRLRLGLPAEGTPLTPEGDAAHELLLLGSIRPLLPFGGVDSPDGPHGSWQDMQWCEAILPGSQR